MIKFVTFQKRCVNSSITDKRPNLTKRNKPTSSSGLMMPNCTLLIVRSGHALSPEGGPCILCIQRDASFLGTSLCEQEWAARPWPGRQRWAGNLRRWYPKDHSSPVAFTAGFSRIKSRALRLRQSPPFSRSTPLSALSASEGLCLQRSAL